MKLSFDTKLAYGIAGIGDAIIYNLTGTFLIFFLNTVVGMNPALAGAVAAVGSVWETLWGGMMGYISDNTRTRFGRRKPYILAGAFPMAVVTALTFTYIDASETLRFFYYCLMLILYWTCFMTFFVPYLAWGADLTDDYNERTVLRGYTFIFDALGAAISMAFPTILVDVMVNAGSGETTAWTAAGLFCGLLSSITILYMALRIKDKDQLAWEKSHGKGQKGGGVRADGEEAGAPDTVTGASVADTVGAPKSLGDAAAPFEVREKTDNALTRFAHAMIDMLKTFVEIFRLEPARDIMIASTFYLVGYAMFTADRIYYLNYNMDLSEWQITFVLIFISLLTILYVPVLNRLCARFDKRSVYIAGMLVTAALMTAAGFLGVSTFGQMLILGAAFNIANSCYWQLVPAMIYDVCEADELASGKKRGGVVVSLQSLAESAGNAIGMQLLGLVLAFGNFDEAAQVQSQTALSLINVGMNILPAVFMVLSGYMVYRYPITRERYAEILRELGKA